jgi:enoyl-CoA hydratase/carnithine racemase
VLRRAGSVILDAMIHRDRQGPVTVLRIEHGKVNALDVELAEAITGELATEARSDSRAVVLTGTGGTFSAGVDLFRVLDGGVEYASRFLPALDRLFRDLFLFPRPVVAAVNGHAIAGGCILACACDRRIMAAGRGRVGVPELLVGVPFPVTAREVMRFALGDAKLQEIVYSGETFPPEAARSHGLVDEIVPEPDLLPRAVQVASDLASIPEMAFQLTKRGIRQAAADRWQQAAAEMGQRVLESWTSPECTAAIRAYIERTLGKARR